jgi:nicotinamide mononucleotide transporter
MSFAAMWMTARKYVENWIVWLVVDVIATGMYAVKGIELYAVLYAVYLGMAFMGWRAWRRTMPSTARSV